MRDDIVDCARTVVGLEDRFIDLAFEMGPIERLDAEEVKRYIRYVADEATKLSLASLPNTQKKFPGINLVDYKKHSQNWPSDNVKALGSEYTSRAWDDKLSPGWGDFVYEAYSDIKSAGIV